MYNSVYRTMIEDNEVRKFLDTFVGPSVSMASILRIVRNATNSLFLRISLDLFLPLTRETSLKILRNFTFKALKNIVFAELYLHQRIWRHLFENGLGLMGLSTYYIMFKIRKTYLDPPADKKKPEASTPAPKGVNSTEAAAATTTKKPGYKRKDEYYYNTGSYDDSNDVYSNQNYPSVYNYQDNYNSPLYGYVPIDEKNDAFYGYGQTASGYEESSYYPNQPSSYPFADDVVDGPPQVDNKFLNSFKTVLAKIKTSLGDSKSNTWSPVASS